MKQSPVMNPHIYSHLIHGKGAKTFKVKKKAYSTSDARKTRQPNTDSENQGDVGGGAPS